MKVKTAIYGICIFSIILIQSTVLDYIKVYGVMPNLMLVFVIAISLLRGNVEGAVIGFFAGLMKDVVSGKVLGFYALLGLYTGLAVGSLNKRLYRENFLVAVFFVFSFTTIYEFAVYFFNTVMKGSFDLMFAFRDVILPEAVYNSIALIPIHILVLRINKRLEDVKRVTRKY